MWFYRQERSAGFFLLEMLLWPWASLCLVLNVNFTKTQNARARITCLMLSFHEENDDLKVVLRLCIHFPLSSTEEGNVSLSPDLGTTFLSSLFRAETGSVHIR